MIRIAVLLTLAAVVGCVPNRRPKPKPDPSPSPAPVVVVTADWSAVTATMRGSDRNLVKQVRDSFAALAWVLDRSDLQTTGDLRSCVATFEKLLFAETELAGKFPGFSAAANAAMTTALGDEDRLLRKGEAGAVIYELSRACQ